MNYLGRQWDRGQILRHVGSVPQLAGIEELVGSVGPGAAVRYLRVRSGHLDFMVIPDRALDIGLCLWNAVPVAWRSPAGVVHPHRYEATGSGWLRTFGGGLLVTCGLDNVGPADACGDREHVGLHGRVGHLSAEWYTHEVKWVGDELELTVRGRTRQCRALGENLIMERTIVTGSDRASIRIADVVVNEGFRPESVLVLYHLNFGFPLISPATRLRWPDATLCTREGGPSSFPRERLQTVSAPAPDFEEEVVGLEPAAGAYTVSIEGPYGTVRVSSDAHELPYLWCWRMFGEGSYVLGIEPANCLLAGRRRNLEHGGFDLLEPGQSVSKHLEIAFAGCGGGVS